MTMTLALPSPTSPTSFEDPNNTINNNNNAPDTTNSPDSPNSPNGTISKRKPARRANTAERRATHNAVERQRRETLNGRFLDLAALLPNLSQIRRPSKSSIVNSSIAHVHASRRHRLLASRELRALKTEADLLRREINEWRDRAGIPRVEEPVRGEGFGSVLAGELEVLVVGADDGEDDEDYDGADYPHPHHHHAHGHAHHQIEEEVLQLKATPAYPFYPPQPHHEQQLRVLPLSPPPPAAYAFDHQALSYAHLAAQEKWAAYHHTHTHAHAHAHAQQQQQQQQQQHAQWDASDSGSSVGGRRRSNSHNSHSASGSASPQSAGGAYELAAGAAAGWGREEPYQGQGVLMGGVAVGAGVKVGAGYGMMM